MAADKVPLSTALRTPDPLIVGRYKGFQVLIDGYYFGTTAGFWMGIQTQYDLERAQDELTGELERIAPVKQAVA